MSDENKTPKEQAEKEVNKRLGKAIANRMLKIRQHQAEIKKLEKEISKIEKGELVPECEDEDNSSKYKPVPDTVISPYYRDNIFTSPSQIKPLYPGTLGGYTITSSNTSSLISPTPSITSVKNKRFMSIRNQ